jgi:hypothetical protein
MERGNIGRRGVAARKKRFKDQAGATFPVNRDASPERVGMHRARTFSRAVSCCGLAKEVGSVPFSGPLLDAVALREHRGGALAGCSC